MSDKCPNCGALKRPSSTSFECGTTYYITCDNYFGGIVDESEMCLRNQVALFKSFVVPLNRLRADGWSVAVHNDYRQDGESHTFWMFARDGRCIKGEGRTDAQALEEVLAAEGITQ